MKTFIVFSSALMATTTIGVSVRQLWEFPTFNMIENIAVRSTSDQILLTTFTNATMYSLDPSAPDEITIAAQIPGKTALTGIAEVAPDKFAIGAGILGNFNFTDNSSSIWLVDFASPEDRVAASVTHVVDLPEVVIINGMVSLPKYPHIILFSESVQGAVYRVDTTTGAVDIAFADEARLGRGPMPTSLLGFNGIRLHAGHLYFAQSSQGYFGRVRISDRGDQLGPIETITTVPAGNTYDDFAITSQGVAYVANHDYTLTRILPDGMQDVLVGPDSEIKLWDPTSAALSHDEKKLYAVTDGATLSNGTTGGQVVEICLH